MRALLVLLLFLPSMVFAASAAFNREAVLQSLGDFIAPKKTTTVYTIVLDPGHGGKDSGARGMGGAEEKNIVLSIAKQLAKKINQTPHMRAVLTRRGDYFIPLRERLRIARQYHADLFIAIHADAYFENKAAGASVYALSQRGATSEAARWLSQRENYSELGEVTFDSLPDQSVMLRSVLIDLAQTASIQESIRLGSTILEALNHVTTLHYKKVEQAPFVVLKSPDIPSILVETGFISNPTEEKRLIDPRYQTQLVYALWLGIDQYVVHHQILSSRDFHSIVRHKLLAVASYEPTYPETDTFIS